MRDKEANMIRCSQGFCIALILVVLGSGCGLITSPKPPETASGGLTTGATRQVAQQTISTSGGTVRISVSGDSLDGLSITIPGGSYSNSRPFTVSESHVDSHTFGPDFDPISPLITISNGGDYSAKPMTLRIPCHIAAGKFAMAFFYDPVTRTLEGMPLVTEDSTGITVATEHFESAADANRTIHGGKVVPNDVSASQIIASQVDISLLSSFNGSSFTPGVDDWQFNNYGSYLSPGGICEGQSQSMMWYYQHRKLGAGAPPLYNLFDVGTPGFQYDDRLAYRLASVVQTDYHSGISANNDIYSAVMDGRIQATQTYWAFAYSIRLTKLPQLCYVGTANAKGKGTAAHAIVAYATDNSQIEVADPNNAGDKKRRITLSGSAWTPYDFGGDGSGNGIPFEQIAYWGNTAFFQWHSISSRFSEFDAGTIGDDLFPKYTLKKLDPNDNFVVLKDGDNVDSVSDLLPSSSTSLKLKLWTSTFQQIPGDGARFTMPPGTNKIGFEITDTNGAWVDFQWLTLTTTGAPASSGCHFTAMQGTEQVPANQGSSNIVGHGQLNIGTAWNEDPTNPYNYSSLSIETKDSVKGPGTYDLYFGTSITRYTLFQGHYYQSEYIWTDGTMTLSRFDQGYVQGTFSFHASHSGLKTDSLITVSGSFSCTP